MVEEILVSKLTGCDNYQDIIELVESRGWGSSDVCARICNYRKMVELAALEEDKAKYSLVVKWLTQYNKDHDKTIDNSKVKKVAIELLSSGSSVMVVSKETGISRTTLYKYKKEIESERREDLLRGGLDE